MKKNILGLTFLMKHNVILFPMEYICPFRWECLAGLFGASIPT
jgi:hypothetical protein